MQPRLLLDTHILIRWLFESRKLTRTQTQAMESAARRGEPLAISALTLLELAVLTNGVRPALEVALDEVFRILRAGSSFQILPLTFEVAQEAGWLDSLRDPADRAIVATARVHRLRLVTSDQRITDSTLVSVVE